MDFSLDHTDILMNRDWDPVYLASIFDQDFNDMSELWSSDMNDREVVHVANHGEIYSPIVEDISFDDSELCHAVEQIENE